jgi:UDP-N-acetyl-D-glucosamine dehydrogenase
MPFYPSAGIGGHCIPVDPGYLAASAREVNSPLTFVEQALSFNHSMGEIIANRAQKMLGDLKNKKVLLVGVAYKPNVSDLRETPAQPLFEALSQKGAILSFHDELVKTWNNLDSVELSADYDLAILVNPHAGSNLKTLGDVPILDTRTTQYRELS